jgi:phospholipid/cholesterol/gamma-HCH transport system permease protein
MVAIALALPTLVLFAIPVGWLGAALVSAVNSQIAVGFNVFFQDLRDVVDTGDVANGVFKSFVFALAIGIISCHQGLITRGGPRGIGRSVTKAVVNSIVSVLILDYFLTRVLIYWQR